jgi:hypothetical protein
MINRDWVAEFENRVDPDETVLFSKMHHEHETSPEFIVAVKTENVPEQYDHLAILGTQEVFFFDPEHKILSSCPSRMLFDRKQAEAVVFDLFKSAEFGLVLIRLSEAFDFDLGKGWYNYKAMTLPAVEHVTRDDR